MKPEDICLLSIRSSSQIPCHKQFPAFSGINVFSKREPPAWKLIVSLAWTELAFATALLVSAVPVLRWLSGQQALRTCTALHPMAGLRPHWDMRTDWR